MGNNSRIKLSSPTFFNQTIVLYSRVSFDAQSYLHVICQHARNIIGKGSLQFTRHPTCNHDMQQLSIMSMLAERKVKEKWCQDPRNTLWSNGEFP